MKSTSKELKVKVKVQAQNRRRLHVELSTFQSVGTLTALAVCHRASILQDSFQEADSNQEFPMEEEKQKYSTECSLTVLSVRLSEEFTKIAGILTHQVIQ